MPIEEDEFLKSTRRGKRQKRRSLEKKERNSLADAATPVDSKPSQKTTNPEDDIQDSKLPPVQEEENIVTAVAASTIQDKGYSSETSGDSETSGISQRKIYITTAKKSQSIEERNSPITASIPFNLTMTSNFNDPPMAYIIDKWLDATSASNDINLMLIANDIKTYSTFKTLDADDIYTLERITSKGTTVKLRPHHAKRVSNICEYISYLNISLKVTLADDPSNWNTGDFNMWKHKGKPKSDAPVVAPPTLATGTGTVQGPSTVDKQ